MRQIDCEVLGGLQWPSKQSDGSAAAWGPLWLWARYESVGLHSPGTMPLEYFRHISNPAYADLNSAHDTPFTFHRLAVHPRHRSSLEAVLLATQRPHPGSTEVYDPWDNAGWTHISVPILFGYRILLIYLLSFFPETLRPSLRGHAQVPLPQVGRVGSPQRRPR